MEGKMFKYAIKLELFYMYFFFKTDGKHKVKQIFKKLRQFQAIKDKYY